MTRADILRFYAATPLWFWPVLCWNLFRLEATLARRRAAGESVLAEIVTNGHGRIRVRWISVTHNRLFAPHDGPSLWILHDLDAYARAFAAACATGKLPRLRPPLRHVAPLAPAAAPLEPG